MMERYWCLCVLLCALVGLVCADYCDPSFYFDPEEDECVPCSQCPDNQIIRQPCGRTQDTVCGPFYEFKLFNMAQPNGREKLPKGIIESDDSSQEGATSVSPLANSEVEVAPEAHKWKELAFSLLGLVGVVAALVLAVFIYLLVAHLRGSRDKAIVLEDGQGHPAIYSRARLFSRDRLSTTDYRENLCHLEQQLRMNKSRNHIVRNLYWKNPQQLFAQQQQHRLDIADEVFEGSMRVATITTPLTAIPELQDDGSRSENSPAVFSPTEEALMPLQPDSAVSIDDISRQS